MHIEQRIWQDGQWQTEQGSVDSHAVQLVLAYGDREVISDPARYQELRSFYPQAHILMGSTSGEILDTLVYDHSIVSTALAFEHTRVSVVSINVNEVPEADSYAAGKKLVELMDKEALRHILVNSEGLKVNGTTLIAGMNDALPPHVSVSGGLAGDADKFTKTVNGVDGPPEEGNIVAIGLHGSHLRVGYSSFGGWDPFGPDRVVTKSEANILYELDHKPALELYKKYLDDKAAELPASGLLFPLSVELNGTKEGETDHVVRTLLAVDEQAQSMTFAGDIPQGATARLMKANFDNLVKGATQAAESSLESMETFQPEFALLVSCVGRKLVLGQRIEDEVETVREIIGDEAFITGFYSYGELAPIGKDQSCLLHNQTMTITLFSEKS